MADLEQIREARTKMYSIEEIKTIRDGMWKKAANNPILEIRLRDCPMMKDGELALQKSSSCYGTNTDAHRKLTAEAFSFKYNMWKLGINVRPLTPTALKVLMNKKLSDEVVRKAVIRISKIISDITVGLEGEVFIARRHMTEKNVRRILQESEELIRKESDAGCLTE